jgi:hypothetical protein
MYGMLIGSGMGVGVGVNVVVGVRLGVSVPVGVPVGVGMVGVGEGGRAAGEEVQPAIKISVSTNKVNCFITV